MRYVRLQRQNERRPSTTTASAIALFTKENRSKIIDQLRKQKVTSAFITKTNLPSPWFDHAVVPTACYDGTDDTAATTGAVVL